MNVERFRAVLKERREALVGSQAKLSALTENGIDKPVNAMTISEIETGAIHDPRIGTIARLVEAMPGLTLAEFFARVEALPGGDGVTDNLDPSPEDPDDDLPSFDTEARITERVIRLLTRYAIKGSERERAENHRLPPSARHPAPERRASDRPSRQRTVPRPKTRRTPKRQKD